MDGLSDAEVVRYARQIVLPEIGGIGQERLRAGSVLVVGAGGLGSPLLLYLAAAGVGRLGVVDDDRVDLSNLHRQVLFETADEGRGKVEAALGHLARLNPLVRLEGHPERLTAANAEAIVSAYDLVADGSDNFATRALVQDACYRLGRPLVSAAVQGLDGQLSTSSPTSVRRTPACAASSPRRPRPTRCPPARKEACSGRPRPSSRACRRSRW